MTTLDLRVVTLGSNSYDILDPVVTPATSIIIHKINLLLGKEYYGPCTVLNLASGDLPDDLRTKNILSTWFPTDDVFSESFTRVVILWLANSRVASYSDEPRVYRGQLRNYPYLQGLGTEDLIIVETATTEISSAILVSGPYYQDPANFYRVARRYEDSQDAFFSSIVQQKRENQITFSEHRPASYIAVPSRIYYPPPSSDLPLSGLRFGAKDVFDIAGLKTSVGSQDFLSLYPAREQTSSIVEDLVGLGAILVGKTKNTQFANGEDPQEWIDYACPWNPRGDGHQNPDTSSSGSASAVASYDWLDFAIGSDTCGSVACPAAAQGLFALRVSTGLAPRDGTFTISKHLDSIGFLSRSLRLLTDISTAWGFRNQNKTQSTSLSHADGHKMPSRILFPWSSFDHNNAEVNTIMDSFLTAMEKYLGMEREIIDLGLEWQKGDPSGTGLSMLEYLNKTSSHLHLPGFRNATCKFREDYIAKTGKSPYFDRVNAAKWKLAGQISEEEESEAFFRMQTFSKWFEDRILHSDNSGTLKGIMLWPFSPQEPQYRDNYPVLTPHVNWRFHVDYTAPFAGIPQVIVPIGQISYYSRITEATEFLPLSMSIVSPRGTDHKLLGFLQEFFDASGLSTSVKTGSLCFEK